MHLLIVLQDQRKWNFKKRCFGINKYMIYLNHYFLNSIEKECIKIKLISYTLLIVYITIVKCRAKGISINILSVGRVLV